MGSDREIVLKSFPSLQGLTQSASPAAAHRGPLRPSGAAGAGCPRLDHSLAPKSTELDSAVFIVRSRACSSCVAPRGVVDLFVVPTVRFRILFVFHVLDHVGRRVLPFDVTEHPTAGWTAAQLVQAFP